MRVARESSMPPGLLKLVIWAALGFFIGAAIIGYFNG